MGSDNRGRHKKGQGGSKIILPGSRNSMPSRSDLVKSWNALSDVQREIYHYNFETYERDKK